VWKEYHWPRLPVRRSSPGAEGAPSPSTDRSIEIEFCDRCGGAVKIIASIEDPQVIGCNLEHLGLSGSDAHRHQLPPVRAPPIGFTGLFD
jgi:hypothetical protein